MSQQELYLEKPKDETVQQDEVIVVEESQEEQPVQKDPYWKDYNEFLVNLA